MVEMKGSVPEFVNYIQQNGVAGFWQEAWPTLFSPIAWKIIAAYSAFEATLQVTVPGKEWIGPVSPAGNRPIYWVRVECNR